jgi:hypothetical protein
LKLQYDELLANCDFDFNLRRYTVGEELGIGYAGAGAGVGAGEGGGGGGGRGGGGVGRDVFLCGGCDEGFLALAGELGQG